MLVIYICSEVDIDIDDIDGLAARGQVEAGVHVLGLWSNAVGNWDGTIPMKPAGKQLGACYLAK